MNAEQQLGPPVPIVTSRTEISPGFVIQTNSGSRREGFVRLRDIVSRHRQMWAKTNLDEYLRSRWEPELRTVAREHSRWLAAKGKGPTLKQFAKFALPAANAWFAGNLGDLFGALGETPPTKPKRVDLMPSDRFAFAARVFSALGGTPTTNKDAWRDGEDDERQVAIQHLADEAPRYVQVHEALGRPPDIQEMRAEYWRWPEGIEAIWPRYAEIVERSRAARMIVAAGGGPGVPPSAPRP